MTKTLKKNNLNKEVCFYKNKGGVIIQGDFNSRTGNLQETVEYNKFFDNDHITAETNTQQDVILRISKDNTITSRGRELIDMCTTNDLYIAIGRKLGDTMGNYTCFQWNGCSVVDYLIASGKILNMYIMYRYSH